MSLAHEGTHYGYLDDKLGPLTEAYVAARCFVSVEDLRSAISELKAAERLHESGSTLFIKRMVEDEEIRCKRAEGGKLSIGHPNTHPPRVPLEGTVDLQKTIARADSDSGSCISVSTNGTALQNSTFPKTWEGDAQFAVFVADYYATGRNLIPEDFAEAWQFCWKTLDFEQKLQRIAALAKRSEEFKSDPQYVPKPRKFLETEWKRDPKPTQKRRDSNGSVATKADASRSVRAIREERELRRKELGYAD